MIRNKKSKLKVNMTVPGEFEVSLTLLGERANTKWTLLDIRILVEDYEIGFGTRLVHPLQVNTVHNVLQLRMDNSNEVPYFHLKSPITNILLLFSLVLSSSYTDHLVNLDVSAVFSYKLR